MLALKVEKVLAENAKQWLRCEGLLLEGVGAKRDSEYVYFPAKKKAETPFSAKWVRKRFLAETKAMTLKDALKGKLPSGEFNKLVSSYDVLGNIAVVEVPPALKRKEKTIASALLKANKRVKTVLKKASAMKGEYRVRDFAWLGGEKNYVAEYKEGGCVFRFDVRKTYFSPRLSFERLRIAQLVTPGEKVLALFAGVGPYALVIAKKQPECEIKAIELNPAAFNWMVENIALNKVKNVEAVKGDVRAVLPALDAWADRVTMPLPHTGEDFLDVAIGATRDGGTIHFYGFGGDKEGVFKRALSAVKNACERNRVVCKILNKRVVRPYAPYVFQVVVDFRISRKRNNQLKLRCVKCNQLAKRVVLPAYEHEKGIILDNVEAFECPSCKEWVFTEKQIEEVEKRTEVAKAHRFGFLRKVTVSGRSLALNLPEDLVRHIGWSKGQAVKIIPLDDKSLLVEGA